LIFSGLQIREALKLQLDAQRCLHEQLEVYSLSFQTLTCDPFPSYKKNSILAKPAESFSNLKHWISHFYLQPALDGRKM